MKTEIDFISSRDGIAIEINCQDSENQIKIESWISDLNDTNTGYSIADRWDQQILRGFKPTAHDIPEAKELKIVDLFCGAGGFTEGIRQGLNSLGIKSQVLAGCDIDKRALKIYAANHAPEVILAKDLNTYIEFSIRKTSETNIRFNAVRFAGKDLSAIEALMGGCDILVAGPPCQGHSNLNNHSRRDDPRNNLYISVAAYAALLKPKYIAIENVQTVVHDKSSVVSRTKSLLKSLGYTISEVTINGTDIGLAQTRKRHFLLAKKSCTYILPLENLISAYKEHFKHPRPVTWCLDVAPKVFDREDEFYLPPATSEENMKRINWLFDNNEFDLPNRLRPKCHQKDHNYKSIYGRLHADKPSGTITTGFTSPGRGRYIHPQERRGLTCCEAALIQGFPLSYKFTDCDDSIGRNQYAKVIGDAVSPQMARVIGQNFGIEHMLASTSFSHQEFLAA